jgi:N-acetylmuramoyl-L-alanine amidase
VLRVVLWVLLAAALAAQTSNPAELYKEALAREAELRAELNAYRNEEPDAELVRRLRTMVGAYQDLARLFPASAYSGNALWQGGVLAADTFLRFGDTADRTMAARLLNTLVARFPASARAREVPVQLRRIQEPASSPASARSASASAEAAAKLADARATREQRPSAAAAASDGGRVPTSGPHTPPDSAPARGPVLLKAIRREILADTLRITLELDRETAFHDEQLATPPRIFIDLQNTTPAPSLKDATIPVTSEVVQRVRVGRQLDARTRVVFDVNALSSYSVYALYNPYRIVIDFERESARRLPPNAPGASWTMAAADPAVAPTSGGAIAPTSDRPGAPTSGGTIAPASDQPVAPSNGRNIAPSPRGPFSLSRQLGLGVARIAIDPGHGGHDPGAKVNGLTEAGLALDVALRLEKLLQQQKDVEVVLTRRTDVYVPLEERAEMANKNGADLFLSIHMNASSSAVARGIETYFLNFASNAEAEAIAARENAGSSRSMRHLTDIVEAIAMNNKIDESRDFARIVQTTLYDRLRKVNPNLRNLGVKQAPFMVLVGANMPSILAEISFMTNRQEVTLLRTEKYRQQIAEALFAGVLRYQESLKKVPTVAAQ